MILDFLKTKRSKTDLKIALDIIREFKTCETQDEWLAVTFAAWTKLEQLEEYLEFLVEGKKLEKDTLLAIKHAAQS